MFAASVWDRLITPVGETSAPLNARCLTYDEAKWAISRDLEALLNTRTLALDEELAAFPKCRNSIVNFGLADFAQLCLSSNEDRKDICSRLKAAIEIHEPRLAGVQVRLARGDSPVNRLDFVISGHLRAIGNGERIEFDATLERSRLHYLVRQSRRKP